MSDQPVPVISIKCKTEKLFTGFTYVSLITHYFFSICVKRSYCVFSQWFLNQNSFI